MNFTSLQYLVFLVISCLVYFILKKKLKMYWLLICSYYFYLCWSPKYSLLMLFSTLITYLSGILISKSKKAKVKKLWVFLAVTINIGILILFKYYSFLIDAINPIINKIFSLTIPDSLNLLLPIGISFYTFKAISYTIDVYRNDTKVEKNIFRYALFVSFFPEIIAGPIDKSKDLLPQLNKEHKFSWDNIHKGSLLITIGFFYKLVIADRAAIVVNQIFNNLNNYTNGGGIYLIVASLLYTMQIYFDFNALSIIAKGSAKILGYDIINNFKLPYFATSIKDFWRRWHISLSSWFKEYLYFPLGGSKKGFIRTQINIMIVFIVSGLWHGAAWTFIIWGTLHGLYQVVENIIFKKRMQNDTLVSKIVGLIVTFCLVSFAWIFFRANSLYDAWIFIKNLLNFGMAMDINLLGMNLLEFIILGIALLVVFILEILSTKIDLIKTFYQKNIILRWSLYYILIFSIIIFGIYGPGFSTQEFIYIQF